MPLYSFRNPQTNEEKDLFFHMNDEKRYVDENDVEWQRVFNPPQGSKDTQVDPWNPQDFVKKTEGKSGKLDDIFQKSEELSQKREQQEGTDPVKEKYYENYAAKRLGRRHPKERRETLKRIEKKYNVKIEE